MAKNKVPASFAVSPELHAEAKDYCERKNISFSEFVCVLVSKAIKLPIDDDPIVVGKPANENVIPIVLKLPKALMGDRDGLQRWMETHTSSIVSKLAGAN